MMKFFRPWLSRPFLRWWAIGTVVFFFLFAGSDFKEDFERERKMTGNQFFVEPPYMVAKDINICGDNEQDIDVFFKTNDDIYVQNYVGSLKFIPEGGTPYRIGYTEGSFPIPKEETSLGFKRDYDTITWVAKVRVGKAFWDGDWPFRTSTFQTKHAYVKSNVFNIYCQ